MNIVSKTQDWVSRRRSRRYPMFVLLTVLPIITFSYFVSRILRDQTHKQLVVESAQIADLSASLVAEHFRQGTIFLESIAARQSVRQGWQKRDLRMVTAEFAKARELRPDFSFISAYDLDGTMRAISPERAGVLTRNFAFRDWYKGLALRGSSYVSEVYRSAVPPEDLVVATAIPILDDQGKPIGILMGAYALDTISRRLVATPLEGWRISLVDQNGHLLARKNIDPHLPLVDMSNYQPVQAMRAGQGGNGIFERDGESLFTRYQPIPESAWGILVEKPSGVLQRNIPTVDRSLWLLGLVFLGGGLLVSAFLGSLYSRLERGNQFIDLSIDMFCVAGFDGYFKALNPSWERTLGFTREELMSRPYSEYVHPEDRDATAREGNRLENGQSTFSFENRYLCRDGSYRWLLWNAVSVPERKQIYAVAHDVTEVKSSVDRIAQQNRELDLRNRQVERATQMKSRFLASMSHELRTPLNAIVGFSDLLNEGTAGQLNEKQLRFVNHIRQGSKHLLQLINDILDISKIEAGQLQLHCEHFAIKHALPEVLSIIRPLAMGKNVTVEENLDADAVVYADRVRFKQILYNLLSNAVKFTPKDGRVHIACESGASFVRISVTDTGVGIKPQDQSIIFEEFRQAEAHASTMQEGTGLGLAITKKLVEQQGGTIGVESEFGRGSCFFFTLPVTAGAVDGEGRSASPSPALQGARSKPLILVVDDEPAARELLASYLSPDYQVMLAASGTEALVKATELGPDAITLDVLMGQGNGFETLVALRKAPETAGIPVIILSVVDQQRVGFALGATDYLVKPIGKTTLVETIRKYVAPRSDEDSSILLVDDDPRALELMEETLRSAGYETQSVRSGARALEVLSSKIVAGVLLDLLMPGVDGFEVIRHIRRDSNLRNLPVFVLTGKTLTQEEKELLGKETQVLLQKGTSWQEQLLSEVRRVVFPEKKKKAVGAK